jgi:putative endonuclease
VVLIARLMFGLVDFAARRGLAGAPAEEPKSAGAPPAAPSEAKHRARRTGIRGETYAYWYLRRHGYTLIARNYTSPGIKGEIDLVGYDGPVLAFVEVKTRAGNPEAQAKPEESITPAKRRLLSRTALRFLNDWHLRQAQYRFDVLALESRPGERPEVRLHKNAFPLER